MQNRHGFSTSLEIAVEFDPQIARHGIRDPLVRRSHVKNSCPRS
jgi:hypothetical protein